MQRKSGLSLSDSRSIIRPRSMGSLFIAEADDWGPLPDTGTTHNAASVYQKERVLALHSAFGVLVLSELPAAVPISNNKHTKKFS